MSTNGSAREVLTPSEAAAYLRLPEAEVVGLVRSRDLPGRRLANEWRCLEAAIEQRLTTGSPGWEARRAAILELAGKYNDDPDLELNVEDAYRRRSGPTSEGSCLREPQQLRDLQRRAGNYVARTICCR